jgi:hypothetical protein
MMKRLAALLTIALVTAVPAAADSPSITLDAGLLTNSSGTPIADGDLVLLLVSPTDVFTPTIGNEFVSGDNLIVSSGNNTSGSVTGAFGMNSSLTVAGETYNFLSFDLGEGATGSTASTIVTNSSIVAGDKLAIRWYSNYTLADFEAGDPVTGNYGTYTTTLVAPNDDGGADWVVPANGGAVDLNFYTVSDVDPTPGDQANVLGEALTPTGDISSAVPEPSTYELLGIGLLVCIALARKKKLVRVAK